MYSPEHSCKEVPVGSVPTPLGLLLGAHWGPNWLNSFPSWNGWKPTANVCSPSAFLSCCAHRLTPSWWPRGLQQGLWMRCWFAPPSTWWRQLTTSASASRATWRLPRERWAHLFVCFWDNSVLPTDFFLIVFISSEKYQRALPEAFSLYHLRGEELPALAAHHAVRPAQALPGAHPLLCPPAACPLFGGSFSICRRFISCTLLPNYFNRFSLCFYSLSGEFWCLMKMSQRLLLIWQLHFIGFDNLKKNMPVLFCKWLAFKYSLQVYFWGNMIDWQTTAALLCKWPKSFVLILE